MEGRSSSRSVRWAAQQPYERPGPEALPRDFLSCSMRPAMIPLPRQDGAPHPRTSERVDIETVGLHSYQRDESWLVLTNHTNPIPLCKRLVRDGLMTRFWPISWRGKSEGFWKRFYPLKLKKVKMRKFFLLLVPSFLLRMPVSGVTAAILWARGTMLLNAEDGRAERKNLGSWWHSWISEPTLELLTSKQLIHVVNKPLSFKHY